MPLANGPGFTEPVPHRKQGALVPPGPLGARLDVLDQQLDDLPLPLPVVRPVDLCYRVLQPSQQRGGFRHMQPVCVRESRLGV